MSANEMTNVLYTQQRFLFMTLDPVHIGTGGYRLGRVDLTIAREPGTNLPKIPGTSLAGVARSYAAMRYRKPDAAGRHEQLKQEEKVNCPIIYTFGTATEAGGGQEGTVRISDARILFFPVASMAGPIWVSTPEAVGEAWGANSVELPKDSETPIEPTDQGKLVTSLEWEKPLNLGWLLLEAQKGLKMKPPDELASQDGWQAIAGRIALVTPKLFTQIVNSNLEVRTSVSIDPATGAAKSGALFTYEAIPRATWLWCDVIEDDYHPNGRNFPKTERQYDPITKKITPVCHLARRGRNRWMWCAPG